jgi:hypothetical protein
MKPVIGLFWHEADISLAVKRLLEAGFSEDKISILTQESAIRRILGCKPVDMVSKYAAWGAFFGITIYGIFGLVAGWCQCNLFSLGQAYGIGAFLGVILGGAFVGGFLGCIAGVAESEKDSHLYVQGARLGGRVIVVQANEEESARVTNILEQQKASGVKSFEWKEDYRDAIRTSM